MKNIIRTPETHPLTWRLRDDKQPVWLDEYRSKNGYEGARKALTGLSPDEIVNQVKDAGLKGRGGAGFSTGLKWSLMPKDESMNIRYLLCNADEMEPGTYKDRLLMEQLPHLLVEGMLISARALKAYRGYIFLRGEYVDAATNLNRAIDAARQQIRFRIQVAPDDPWLIVAVDQLDARTNTVRNRISPRVPTLHQAGSLEREQPRASVQRLDGVFMQQQRRQVVRTILESEIGRLANHRAPLRYRHCPQGGSRLLDAGRLVQRRHGAYHPASAVQPFLA